MNAHRVIRLLRHPKEVLKHFSHRIRYPLYKTHVGPPDLYEELGRYQFDMLQSWGLRPHHFLLDVGCGSLRAGKFFIRYLDTGRYFGIEPNSRVLKSGIAHNLDKATLVEKRPSFSHVSDFNLGVFSKKFDFLLAHSIFTHADQSQIKRCFLEAHNVMLDKAVFFANYNKGESDYGKTGWVYPAHVTYTFQCISSLAQEAGLGCFELGVTHPTGASWILACNPIDASRLMELRKSQKTDNVESSSLA